MSLAYLDRGYKNAEQEEFAQEVRNLTARIEKSNNPDEVQALSSEREGLSTQLARWLRKNYPDKFRVFEFNEAGQPHEESPVHTVNPGKMFGRTEQQAEKLAEWKQKYGVQQDDILIFHPTNQFPRTYVFYMATDDAAAYSLYDSMQGVAFTIDNILAALGLTRNAAQSLWFPKGGFKLFGKAAKNEKI